MGKPTTDPDTHKCVCCLANRGYFSDPAVKAKKSKNGHTFNATIIRDGPRQGEKECDQLVKRAAPKGRAAAASAGGGGSSRQSAAATLSAGLGGMRLGASDGTAASSGAPAAAAAVAAEDEDGSIGHLFGEDGSGSDGSGSDGFNFELNPQARRPRHRFGEAERAKARMDAINAAPAAEPPASAAAGGGGAGGSGDGHLGQTDVDA